MSKTNFIAAIAAACALVACTEKTVDLPSVNDDERVSVQLEAMTSETKTLLEADGDELNDLQFLLFDADGTLEAYKRETSVTKCDLVCTKGWKTVVVIANSKTELSSVETMEELKTYKSDLFENTATACVMEGAAKVNVENSRTINVTLSRHVARIILNNLTVDFELDYLKTAEVKLKAVYMINLVGEKYFQSSEVESQVWYNKMNPDVVAKDIVYDDCGSVELTNGITYDTQHRFFFYPNANHTDRTDTEWSPRATKCVVELLVDGTTYYYPMALTYNTYSNYDYLINLTITRLGSDSPDQTVIKNTLGNNIYVASWGESTTINLTI